MAARNGSEPDGTFAARGSLILLAAATLGSCLLFTALPADGLQGSLRVLSLLPLQLAALLWVLPRMR